jgi:thiol-disulfide isomerase/thioredoxin
MKSKISFVFLALFCLVITAKAQLATQLVDHFNKLKNVSYKSTNISKDFFSDQLYFDTLQSTIVKQGDQLTFRFKGNKQEDIYDGSKLFKLQFSDHTYRLATNATEASHYYNSLPYLIKRIADNLQKGIKAVQFPDSIVNGKSYAHFKIKELDSIKNNKHVFSQTTVLIDKKANLPYYYRNNSKGFIDGTNTYLVVFNEYRFTDYQLNVARPIDLAKTVLPADFTPEKPKVSLPLLAKGTSAPEIPLYNLNGEAMQLSVFKGKVLLLNFTINGCPHCVESIETLNKLQEKYKTTDFFIITINLFDDKAAILKFDKNFDVKYHTYTSDKSTKEKYRVQAYPLFYLIDKSGKITNSYDGFSTAIGVQMVDEIQRLIP